MWHVSGDFNTYNTGSKGAECFRSSLAILKQVGVQRLVHDGETNHEICTGGCKLEVCSAPQHLILLPVQIAAKGKLKMMKGGKHLLDPPAAGCYQRQTERG
ncbi:hypothetical protein PGTUg99_001380 [Puccinia graminis f. sp. tritici]|uniref:Uncharacterized protein n=1 Tax=Puccinia graminis f. sp. tritici TaxID=56615 RepID=A0A5B0QZT2_PUCGR|nr:hypothetical protein PGTUg99_001380 [Puccinia graminis f. sp. tritici]